MRPTQLTANFSRIYDGLHKTAQLETCAAVADPEQAEYFAEQKVAASAITFELVKRAFSLAGAESGLQAIGNAVKPYGKTLATTAAIGVPTAMLADHVSDHFTESARNNALQAGVGLAGIGAGMYGLHRLTGGGKQASDEYAAYNDAITKLAAIGYLDAQLSNIPESASDETKKLATELALLNREFGIDILNRLSKPE